MSEFNLHHSTFKQALIYAKWLSRLTNEEISEYSGINGSRIARYFQENDAYTPSPELIPLLCRTMGNTVLVDWINAQVEELRPVAAITNASDLTIAVMQATKNTGDLSSKTMEAIADGNISQQEALTLQAQFRKNGDWNYRAVSALDILAGGNNHG